MSRASRGDDELARLIDETGAPSDPDEPRDGAHLASLADVRSEPVRWLWPGWLARGKLHILAGAPGTGKTTVALALAATVSSAGRWPDGQKAPLGSVLVWSGEDDLADTLAPRLRAAGADENRIFFVGGMRRGGKIQAFDPARDLPALATAAEEIGDVGMLVADPIVSALGQADSHKNSETRNALAPLVHLGQQLDAAVIGITHHSKGTAGRDPVERVTGSVAFGAVARIVLSAAKREQPEPGQASRLLVRAKSNIGPDGGGFGYGLMQHAGPDGIEASTIAWAGPLEGTARALLAAAEPAEKAAGRPDSERGEAVDWLRDALSDGAVAVGELKADARAAGISWRTAQRAKDELGVRSFREGAIGAGKGAGGWFWTLPDQGRHNPIPSNSGILNRNGYPVENKEVFPDQECHNDQGCQNSRTVNASGGLDAERLADGDAPADGFEDFEL